MSIDRGQLELQLQELGDPSRWWDYRELRDLPALLHADERIVALARGKIGRPRVLRRTWLIVVTDARMVCVRSARGGGWRQLELGGRHITRVALRVGPFRGRVLVAGDGHTYRLLTSRADAYRIHAALSRLGAPAKEMFSSFAPTRMVRSMIDHVLALPAIALDPGTAGRAQAPAPDAAAAAALAAAMERRIQPLEEQVHQLREQVEFLEKLLQQRSLPALEAAIDRDGSEY